MAIPGLFATVMPTFVPRAASSVVEHRSGVEKTPTESATNLYNVRLEVRFVSPLPLSNRVPMLESLECRRLLSIAPAVVPAPVGSLSGKVVFTSGGHGFAANGNLWNTGRGLTNGMVEDMGNQDQLLPYADSLLRAGAMVVPLRPVGYQPIEVIVDNTSASVTWSGSWSDSSNAIYYGGADSVVGVATMEFEDIIGPLVRGCNPAKY